MGIYFRFSELEFHFRCTRNLIKDWRQRHWGQFRLSTTDSRLSSEKRVSRGAPSLTQLLSAERLQEEVYRGLDFHVHSAHYWLQLSKPFMSSILMWADLFRILGCFFWGWFRQLCHVCLLSRASLHKYLSILLPLTLLSSSEWVLNGRVEKKNK